MRGRDKLAEPVEGQPLLARQTRAALATGATVYVALRPDDDRRAGLIAGLPVTVVPVPDAQLGMASALRRGVAALPADTAAVTILPADMPELDADALCRLHAAFDAQSDPVLVQATTSDGVRGHPVLFPADCFAAFRMLSGDSGARQILKANAHRVIPVALPGNAAITDLDTPEAWATWRAENRTGQS